MPIVEDATYRGSNSTGSGTSVTATFGNTSKPAVAGQLLICMGLVGDTIANVTKPSGYTDLFIPLQISGGFALFAAAKIAAGGETGIAYVTAAAGSKAAVVHAANGALSPLSIDGAATDPTDFSQHQSWPTGTIGATTNPDDLIIGVAGLNGAGSVPSVNVGTLVDAFFNNQLLVSFNPVVATGGQSMTFSWTGLNFVVAGIAAIKAAPLGWSGWDAV